MTSQIHIHRRKKLQKALDENKAEIKFLFNYYIKTVWNKGGLTWCDTHEDEINDLVNRLDKQIILRVREIVGRNKRLRERLFSEEEK